MAALTCRSRNPYPMTIKRLFGLKRESANCWAYHFKIGLRPISCCFAPPMIRSRRPSSVNQFEEPCNLKKGWQPVCSRNSELGLGFHVARDRESEKIGSAFGVLRIPGTYGLTAART